MNEKVIGQCAGKIWNALNENGAMTYMEIKAATELVNAHLFAALGWLAREGKIGFDGDTVELV